MKPTQALHEAGQSIWLDNVTRVPLDEETLARYVAEYWVTGLTSNPTIFGRAIRDGTAYDAPGTVDQAESLHRQSAAEAYLRAGDR
jgi:transaldolase